LVLEAERVVRVRLEPHVLDDRHAGRGMRVCSGAVVDRQHALRSPRDLGQTRVRGDRVQPRSQRAATLETSQPAPRPQQRLLQRIVGVEDRTEHPVAVGVKLAAERLDQVLE
jgi:hypothetical protein